MRINKGFIAILLLVGLAGVGATFYLSYEFNVADRENASLRKELEKKEVLLLKQQKRIDSLRSRLKSDEEIRAEQMDLVALHTEISDLDRQVIELFKTINEHLSEAVKQTNEGNEQAANDHIREANTAVAQVNNILDRANEKVERVNELLVQFTGQAGKET